MSADPMHDSGPEQAAAYWFTRRRANSMTVEEGRAFDVWLDRSEHNRRAYEEMQAVWLVLGELEDDPGFIDLRGRDDRDAVVATRRRAAVGWAAMLAVAVAGGWALSSVDVRERLGLWKPAPAQEFRTVLGERKNITLADGSIITLNTDTVLHVRFSGRDRLIELNRGQASFEVAKDKSRPFIVLAGDKTVRATGTVFDVRLDTDRFEVMLIEGRVRVQERGAKREDTPLADMRQGWKLAVGEDARWRMEPVDLVKETSWHDGMLIFQRDTLADAVSEMNRYSARKIVFSGDPPNTTVLGMFKAGDVDSFVRIIEINKLARVTARSADSVELSAP